MNLKNLFTEERAVSPVIGVVLMVAITVILAAVVGSFVLGLAGDVSETAPTAQISFEYDSGEVTLIHDGGSSFSSDNVRLTGSGGTDNPLEDWGNGQVSAGDSVTVDISEEDEGNTLRVIWQGSSSSSTIARSTVPSGFSSS